MRRIYSIDVTRGIVMMIMALDHTRDLLHVTSVTQSPTDLSTTTPILFFTRWITYLCAPIFVFLAGTSAYLSFQKKNDASLSGKFLRKRGLLLIALEFSLVNLGLFFDLGFHTLIFEVIATIGFGFIILSLLLRLPPKTIGVIGLSIIFLHNLLGFEPFGPYSVINMIISPFFNPGATLIFSHRVFVMGYPPIPWLGIMLTGFAAGKLFRLPVENRRRIFLFTGASMLLLFLIVRFVNIYGEPLKWAYQRNSIYTFLSFVNITKYPPSLLFCLVTLGIMFLILTFSEKETGIAKIASVYGKAPLFYFVVHFYIIHTILIIILFLQGFHWPELDFASGTFGRPKGQVSGIPLWAVYLIWAGVVAILYKPCLWFGKYKAEHRQWWLKYI